MSYIFEFNRKYDNAPSRLDLFEFNVDLKPQSQGFEVEILKLYFGLTSSPGENETDKNFDNRLSLKVSEFQRIHLTEIKEFIANNSDSGAQINEADRVRGLTDIPGAIIDNTRIFESRFSEQGEVGDVTFNVLMNHGFAGAINDFLNSEYYSSYLNRLSKEKPGSPYRGGAKSAVDPYGNITVFPKENSDKQQPPSIVNKGFIMYNYVTDYTLKDFPSKDSFYTEKGIPTLRKIFRDSVLEIFNFYDKDQTWLMQGSKTKFKSRYQNIIDAINSNLGSDNPKIEDLTRYTFTALDTPVESLLTPDSSIDVLFGESLEPGKDINFAGIYELSPPSLRPTAVWNIKVQVKKEMFNEIPGGRSASKKSQAFEVTDPNSFAELGRRYDREKEKAKRLYGQAKAVYGAGASTAKAFSELTPNKVEKQMDKLYQGAKRKVLSDLSKKGKNMWTQAKTGQGGLTPAQSNGLAKKAVENINSNRSLDYLPATLEVNVKTFEQDLKQIAAKIKEYDEDVKTFVSENTLGRNQAEKYQKNEPPISPAIDAIDIGNKLEAMIPPILELLEMNYNYTLGSRKSESEFNDKAKLKFDFAPVQEDINNVLRTDPGTTSTNVGNTGVEVCTGQEIIGMSLDGVELTIGNDIYTREKGQTPFMDATAVAFLSQFDRVKEELKEDPCSDLEEGRPAIVFFSRFHWPELQIAFNPREEPDMFSFDASINAEVRTKKGTHVKRLKSIGDIKQAAILNATQEFKESRKLISNSIDNVIGMLAVQVPEDPIQLPNRWPKIEIPCDIEKMWREFINQFDMDYLLCDLVRCVPDLPTWNFSFSWTIPWFSFDLPSWDPMSFILPRIRIAINDIILSFICDLIASILKTITKPDCTDLLRYGVAAFSELTKKEDDNPFASAEEKAETVEKASQTLENMGITNFTLGANDENLLEKVSIVLTPTELCDLLRGQATDDVLFIVLRITQNTDNNLREILNDINKIQTFFRTLGTVVDPFICDRIEELNDIVIAQELCQTGEDLRSMLQNAGATEDQIQSELDALEQKKRILSDLAIAGDLSELLPNLSPEELKDAGLPGPYNNEFHDDLFKRTVLTILSAFKTYFQAEISAYPSTILEEVTTLPKPGEEGFEELDYLRFMWYTKQTQIMANPEQREQTDTESFLGVDPPPPTPPRKIKKFVKIADSAGLLYATLLDLGIPERDFEHFQYAPLAGSKYDLEEDGQEEFNADIERYLVGYVNKYSEFTYTVPTVLKSLLKDSATVTRIYPRLLADPADGARQLTVAVQLEPKDKFPLLIAGETRQSAKEIVSVTDLPFLDDNIKDCYRIRYTIPESQEVFEKTYKDQIPQQYIEKRKENKDIVSDIHRDKLLRPGAFADFLITKYKDLIPDDRLGRNNLDLYSDDTITSKIQGYIGLKGLERRNEYEEATKYMPLYCSVVDSFNFHLSSNIKKSRYFEPSEVQSLNDNITKEYIVGEDGCLTKNDKIIDLEAIIDQFVENFNKTISQPKHDPFDRIFSKKGPYEEAMVESLFKLYIDMVCLEALLKNIFLLSSVGADSILNNKIILDYITETATVELTNFLGNRLNRKLQQVVSEATGIEDFSSAVRSMVLRNIDFDFVSKFVFDLFEPASHSFKDLIYKEMSENIKDYPSVTDYPKVTVVNPASNFFSAQTTVDVLQRYNDIGDIGTRYREGELDVAEAEYLISLMNGDGFIDVPVAARLPSLVDKFRFEGYSEELIQKKINSGHFWIERFYKIDNFEEFKAKYNQIVQLCSNDPFITRLQSISDHQETMSAEDLEALLFGYESVESFEETERVLNESFEIQSVEYDFIKNVFLALLSNLFLERTNLGILDPTKCIAFKIMQDIGMSQPSSDPLRDPNEKIKLMDSTRFDDFTQIILNSTTLRAEIDRRARVNLRGEPSPPLTLAEKTEILYRNTNLVLGDVVKTEPFDSSQSSEVDLAYRTGAVTKEQLVDRMIHRFRVVNQQESVGFSDDLDGPLLGQEQDRIFATQPMETPWTREYSELYHQPTFGDRTNDYLPFVKTINCMVKKSSLLSLERRAELVVDCLTRFVELSHNWVGGEIPGVSSAPVFEPVWRDSDRIVGSGFSTAKQNLLRSTSTSIPAYNQKFPALPADDISDARTEILNGRFDKEGKDILKGSDGSILDTTLIFNFIETTNYPNTIKYQENNVKQNDLLSWYISEVFTVRSPIRISQSRSGIFNIGADIDPSALGTVNPTPDIRGIVPPRNVDSAEVANQQLALYTMLKQNLHVGYRLMFGHSVRRTEKDRYDSDNFIRPTEIFRDISAENSGFLGLSEVHIGEFTKNKSFLGHVETDPVRFNSEETTLGNLNPNSIFFNNARKVLENYNTRFLAGDTANADQQNNIDFMPPEIQDNLVYCIPVDEVIKRVECFDDIYAEYEQIAKRPILDRLQNVEQYIEELAQSDDQYFIDYFDNLLKQETERYEQLNAELDQLRERYAAAVADYEEDPYYETGVFSIRPDAGVLGEGEFTRQRREEQERIARGEEPRRIPKPRPSDDAIREKVQEIRETLHRQGIYRANKESAEAGEYNTDEVSMGLAALETERQATIREYDTNGFFNVFETDAERVRGGVFQVRRKFLKNNFLFEKYHQSLMTEILSYNVDEGKVQNVISDDELEKPHRMLFDYFFPLDKYAALHFIHNMEIYNQNVEDGQELLKASKLFIINVLLAMQGMGGQDPLDTQQEIEESNIANTLRDNAGSDGFLPSPSDLLRMLREMIKKFAEQAAVAAFRGLADNADPGYREMRKGYKKDPCSMASGLTTGLIRKGLIDMDGNLSDGFGVRGGCKYYVPINRFGSDFAKAMSNQEYVKAAQSVRHLVGTFEPGQSVRYGFPMTPIGNIAVTLPENKGEKHTRLKRDNNCEDGCVEKPASPPEGRCEDKQQNQQEQQTNE